VCIMWILNMLWITFFNLFIFQEDTLPSVPFYIWFGYVVFGFFGMNGSRLFSNNVKSIMQLLEKVKITFLQWLKAKNVCFSFGYHLWWQQPLVCLVIGRFILADCFFTFFCFTTITCCNFVMLLYAVVVLGSIILPMC